MSCSGTYARGSGKGITGPLLNIEEVDAEVVDTQTITSSTGVVNFSNVRVTGLPSQGIDSVGINVLEDRAQILFGTSPFPPSITLDVPRALVTADLADLSGFLDIDIGQIQNLQSANIKASSLQSQSIETPSITTGGQEIYVDWNLTTTQLPGIAIANNPLLGYNSDGSKGGFKIGEFLISLGEAAAGEALMYLAKQSGGWLLSAGQDALSAFSGYASLSEAGLSLGADAAGTGAALGGDLAAFEAGSEGLVLASTASDAAAMFSSAGVLSTEGLAFSELGEAGESLLAGLESSTAEFEEVIQSPSLVQTIAGANRWLAL